MIVNTRFLFGTLLAPLSIDTIADVGSMDGADARYFRRRSRASRIYAFEAHPDNHRRMTADGCLAAADIHVIGRAVSDVDGEASFYLVPAGDSLPRDQRGMSSMYRRSRPDLALAEVRVETTRLDSYFEVMMPARTRMALWIDVEGKAAEVIAGARGIAEAVQLVHVEVETIPCIGAGQRLYPEVRAALEALGFVQIASDRSLDAHQFNAVFVRGKALRDRRVVIRALLVQARLRRLLAEIAYTIAPRAVRRLSVWLRARH